MLCLIVLLYAAVSLSVQEEYYGKLLGSFPANSAHDVSGDVYAMSDSAIFIKSFTYDGQGPDAYFWVGKDGSTPNDNGMKIPDEDGGTSKLGAYHGKDLVLHLDSISAIKYFSVWCRLAKANFGHLVIPDTFQVPAPKQIGSLPTASAAHQLKSGPLTVLNEKTIRISNLNYDGTGPDTFFLVGKGSPSPGGTKVPDETGSIRILRAYQGETITLSLPGDLTVFDVDYLSVYCVKFSEDFGHVTIPGDLTGKIPASKATASESTDTYKCQTLLDRKYNVNWKVDNDVIRFILDGQISPGEYMAFGLSGSDGTSSMENADVVVAYVDSNSNQAKAIDYRVRDYAQCSSEQGVCPDDQVGGNNDVIQTSGGFNDGISSISYSRKLQTGDTIDKAYSLTEDQYVVWALGSINAAGLVVKHTKRIEGNLLINFGNSSSAGCTAVEPLKSAPVAPWPGHKLFGKDAKEFTFEIGQSGEEKGYYGITGNVAWGIVYYVNGILIPELVLKRGDTYNFIIKTGKNEAVTAQYHPVYISTDPDGGYTHHNAEQRKKIKVFAGLGGNGKPKNEAVGDLCMYEIIDSSKKPAMYTTFEGYKKNLRLECHDPKMYGNFTWTPDKNTPDLVYYQCYQHPYFGWKIHIVDEYSDHLGMASVTKPRLTVTILCLIYFTVNYWLW